MTHTGHQFHTRAQIQRNEPNAAFRARELTVRPWRSHCEITIPFIWAIRGGSLRINALAAGWTRFSGLPIGIMGVHILSSIIPPCVIGTQRANQTRAPFVESRIRCIPRHCVSAIVSIVRCTFRYNPGYNPFSLASSRFLTLFLYHIHPTCTQELELENFQ